MNLKKLRRMLFEAQFNMTKADRIIYGTPLMRNCGKAVAAFILAYTIKDRHIAYMEECMGYFYTLKIDLEFCVEEHILKYPKKHRAIAANGEIIPVKGDADSVSSRLIELFRLVGEIDRDICRWRASLAKGQDCV